MPVANCLLGPSCPTQPGDPDELINAWAALSGQDQSEKTVNLMWAQAQAGRPYAVIATLVLPDLWPPTKVSLLQNGLAGALASYLEVPVTEVLVTTQMVASGHVVDGGDQVAWC